MLKAFYNVGFVDGVADICEVSLEAYKCSIEGKRQDRIELDFNGEVVYVNVVNENGDCVISTPNWNIAQLKSHLNEIDDIVHGDD